MFAKNTYEQPPTQNYVEQDVSDINENPDDAGVWNDVNNKIFENINDKVHIVNVNETKKRSTKRSKKKVEKKGSALNLRRTI